LLIAEIVILREQAVEEPFVRGPADLAHRQGAEAASVISSGLVSIRTGGALVRGRHGLRVVHCGGGNVM
jgi:hypothetical protein